MRNIWMPVWLLVVLSLSACASVETVSAQDAVAAEAAARPKTMELEFVAEGQVKSVPASLYLGDGYSIYIPEMGWMSEREREDGIPEDVWESVTDDEVQDSVPATETIPIGFSPRRIPSRKLRKLRCSLPPLQTLLTWTRWRVTR